MNERAQLRKARRYEAMDEESVHTALRALLGSPDGRKFVGWLMDITHFQQTPFTGNALTTSFKLGEQNIGQQFLALATDVDPEGFLNFLTERANEYRQRQLDLDNAAGRDPVNYHDDPDADEG